MSTLRLDDAARRAHVHAGSAVFAFGSVDGVELPVQGDRAFRALRFACAALDALIFHNYVSHV